MNRIAECFIIYTRLKLLCDSNVLPCPYRYLIVGSREIVLFLITYVVVLHCILIKVTITSRLVPYNIPGCPPVYVDQGNYNGSSCSL